MPDNYSWYYDQIKDATLELIEDGKSVKTFLLRKYPDRSMMSSWLFFTPVGIIISGDMRPAENGVIALGYGLDWFAQKLEADYLAEKFLKKTWVPEQALQSWKECLTSWENRYQEYKNCIQPDEDEEQFEPDEPLLKKMDWHYGTEPTEELESVTIIEVLRALIANPYYFESAHILYDSLPCYLEDDTFYHCPFSGEDLGGRGYSVSEVGWLYAIQHRFSECYSKIIESRNNNA